MNGIALVGLSHKTAPVDVRERCRVGELAASLAELRELADEAAIVSTCNRFEVYTYGARDDAAILQWITARAGADIAEHAYARLGRNACKHLFFVTASLDSLVVGETQIRRQIKDAYQGAIDAGTVGPILHRLFQSALRVSKEIADSTGVGRGNVSVAGAAADLAERVFRDLDSAMVLIVGAGETAELVTHHLVSRGVKRFRVVNRTIENGRALAEMVNAPYGGLDELEDHLPRTDVLVCAAGGDEPLVTCDAMRTAVRRRRGRPMVAIDIAVPRGVDPAVDSLDNVYRYDMDTLAAVTQDALRHRRREFLQCCTLVDGATLRLHEETRALRAGGSIAELQSSYRDVAAAELAELERRLPQLDDDGRHQIQRAFHRMVKKLLHTPMRALRTGDPEEQEVIKRAFGVRPRGDRE